MKLADKNSYFWKFGELTKDWKQIINKFLFGESNYLTQNKKKQKLLRIIVNIIT